MSQKSGIPDPFEVWRSWIDQSERQLNEVLNDAMGGDQFTQASARFFELATLFQSTMNEATQKYFTALNLPTRSDVLGVAERLSEVEERLVRVERLLERLAEGTASSNSLRRPARTRQPASSESAPAKTVATKRPVQKKAAKKKAAKKKVTRKRSSK